MTDRLFFALWPSVEQRLALTRIQRELVPDHPRTTHPEDLHITLVFLGDMTPAQRSCAEAAADRVSSAPVRLVLDRIDFFRRAQVLWCGPSERPGTLVELVGALNKELFDCGFLPESRAYTPHVTLARNARPIDGCDLTPSIVWPADELVLATTDGKPAPRYRILRRWPLA